MSNKPKVVQMNGVRKKRIEQNAVPGKPMQLNASTLTGCHCPQCKGNIFFPAFTIFELPSAEGAAPALYPVRAWLCVNSQCGKVSQENELLRVTPEERNEMIKKFIQSPGQAEDTPNAG